MRTAPVSLLLFALCSASSLLFSADEQPVTVTLRSGSRLQGMLSSSKPLAIRTQRGQTPLDWKNIARLLVGERIDPNKENEARNALGDLASDDYATRQKAQKALRDLGRAAIRPLRETMTLPDPELSRQARTLLAEMGELGNPSATGDELVMKDGSKRRGDVTPATVQLRTRWGCWSVPLEALDDIEPLAPERLAVGDLVAAMVNPPALQTRQNAEALAAQPWSPTEQGGANEDAPQWQRSMIMLDFDLVPGLSEQNRPMRKPVAEGDDLSNAYASRGLLLRLADADKKATAQKVEMNSMSGALGLKIESGALWVHPIQPGTFDIKTGLSDAAGSHTIGAYVGAGAARSVGLAAYDKAGRLLGVVYNEGLQIPPELRNRDVELEGATEFLAIRSALPIARARFFRVGEAKDKPLLVDDLFVDSIVSIDRPPDLFGITLRSGERLCGALKSADWEKGLSIQVEFLAEDAKPVGVQTDDIVVLDTPGRQPALSPAEAKRYRMAIGNQHGVLLQNGEKFHGCFVKLDDKEALFLMSGQVEFRLPRGLLRKIDLRPAYDPDTGRATVALAEGEKPGVEFRQREKKPQDPAAPLPEEAPKEEGKAGKNNLLQQQQELKRMDDAEIVEADILSGDLTVDDGGGDWTIGLAPVKALVFPPDPAAAAQQPGFREWQIEMRDRSRFDVVPMAITNDTLTVQIARGVVQMPHTLYQSLRRKK